MGFRKAIAMCGLGVIALAAPLAIGTVGSAPAAEPVAVDPTQLSVSLTKTLDDLKQGLQEIAPTPHSTTNHCDALAAEALNLLAFARDAYERGDIALAYDSLSVAHGLIAAALTELPIVSTDDPDTPLPSTTGDATAPEQQKVELTVEDIRNVKAMVDRLAARSSAPIDIPETLGRLERAGFDMAKLKRTLGGASLSATDVALRLERKSEHMTALSSGLPDLSDDPLTEADITAELRDLTSRMGIDLQNVLDAVAGVRDGIEASGDLDLEDATEDTGLGRFAEAVNTVSQAHDTQLNGNGGVNALSIATD